MTKPSQAEVREINRSLLATVRADWSFPDTDDRPRRNPRAIDAKPIPIPQPIAYCERFYGTSDDDDDSDSDSVSDGQDHYDDYDERADDGEHDGINDAPRTSSDHRMADPPDPQMPNKGKRRPVFESPDSVREVVDRKMEARKRRRRNATVEEMAYNGGLCFYLRRRNAWVGAVARPVSVKAGLGRPADGSLPLTAESAEPEGTLNNTTATATATATASSTPSGHGITPPSDSHPSPSPSPSSSSPFDPPTDPTAITDVLVPIATPFLPATHPVRVSILARSDSELYEKIVRDSRTPAVPVNLAHMVRVIVQGWKDEGNWPPRAANADPAAVHRHRLALRKAEEAEVRRGIFANHRHLKKGVESVRRAFRLSGSAPSQGD
jgi:hypothetical protein